MSNIKISQLTQFTASPRNTWLVMNNSAQTETFKITRETLLSGLIQCSNLLASDSVQSNNIFPEDDVDLNISTRTDSGTKGINLMTGPKPGGLGYIRIKITSGGTVGINTDAPNAQLDVSVPTGSTVGLRISGNSNTDMVRITQVGTGHTFVVEDSQNPDSTPFVIRNDGKVYMGTYTDDTTSILNVGGNAHFFGNVYFNGTANIAIQNSVPERTLINFASVGNSYFNNGNLGVGTILPQARLDVTPPTGSTVGLRVSGNSSTDMVRITQTGSGNALIVEGNIIYPSPSTPPVSSGSTGTKGTVTWDGSYFYICVDTNTWKRSQLLSW
jgi:hypothetical protein